MSKMMARVLLAGSVTLFLLGVLAISSGAMDQDVAAWQPSPRPPWNTLTPTVTATSPTDTATATATEPTPTVSATAPTATSPPPTSPPPTVVPGTAAPTSAGDVEPQILPVTGSGINPLFWLGLGIALMLLGSLAGLRRTGDGL